MASFVNTYIHTTKIQAWSESILNSNATVEYVHCVIVLGLGLPHKRTLTNTCSNPVEVKVDRRYIAVTRGSKFRIWSKTFLTSGL